MIVLLFSIEYDVITHSSKSSSYTKNVWNPFGTLVLHAALITGVLLIVLASHIKNYDLSVL